MLASTSVVLSQPAQQLLMIGIDVLQMGLRLLKGQDRRLGIRRLNQSEHGDVHVSAHSAGNLSALIMTQASQ
jgi:hypothetical protein